jgi:pyridinium-3,5-biscarboxylic acid mononucleotide sulfurtransferase
MKTQNNTLANKRDRLLDELASYGSCLVAYSGGVDSAVVAMAAHLALGEQSVAVTGVSPSLADGELEQASALAAQIGIRHEQLQTDELTSPGYVANAPDRCFHCKSELYSRLATLAQQLEIREIASGTNADDLGDYRPGLAASAALRIRQPLADCGIAKADVRELAAAWALSVAEKPASPCLSSRIAYGQSVTPERLRMVDLAEQFVRGLGFPICRVRYRAEDVASVEVPRELVAQLQQGAQGHALQMELRRLGFRRVEIDPAGFRSGSLNESLLLHQIQPMSAR